MATTRRKAPKQDAPVTIEEATRMLGDYAQLQLNIEQLEATAKGAIAAIQAERDEAIAPVKEQAEQLFRQLRAWWAVAGPQLTEGKRKSLPIAGCIIGVRTSGPKLKLPKGMNEAAAIKWLRGLANGIGDAFIRVKESLDKPALIKAVDEPGFTGPLLTVQGFRASQTEEFFIDLAQVKPAAVEQVETEEPGE
ncbi:host-nuclease inhibitor Gam family protein [Sphingomonas sp. CCH15-F11]|uniref:host-nuclease inhibitor Gam family protein n=1 Tax=Sphingomonas sp. CCH15-F11 TaxID=1768785 RepID=UPI0008345865|nr:host-nuclease inhibitor Gam family protein [Sphingomonas sp. CCH15-F11]